MWHGKRGGRRGRTVHGNGQGVGAGTINSANDSSSINRNDTSRILGIDDSMAMEDTTCKYV